MRARLWAVTAVICSAVAACATGAPPVPTGPYGSPQGSADVVAPRESPPPAAPAPSVPRKEFRLSPASAALVTQAHTQHKAGNGAVATATLERALRIEPH